MQVKHYMNASEGCAIQLQQEKSMSMSIGAVGKLPQTVLASDAKLDFAKS